MTKTELIKDIERFCGSGFINRKELTIYLGYKDPKIVSKRFLNNIQPVTGKRYSVIDIAEQIMEAK